MMKKKNAANSLDGVQKKKITPKKIAIAFGVIIILGGLANLLDGGGQDTATPDTDIKTVVETDQTEENASAEDADKAEEEPQEEVGEKTSGGIGYGQAVAACDQAAQEQLFLGSKYDSHAILGQQKAQLGLSEDQFLAVYNVEVDGRKTAVTCLVDGTKDDVHVISINETEAR